MWITHLVDKLLCDCTVTSTSWGQWHKSGKSSYFPPTGLVSMPGDGLVWSLVFILVLGQEVFSQGTSQTRTSEFQSNLEKCTQHMQMSSSELLLNLDGWTNYIIFFLFTTFFQDHASCTTKMNKSKEVLFKTSCQRNSPWQTHKLCILHIILCNWYLGL